LPDQIIQYVMKKSARFTKMKTLVSDSSGNWSRKIRSSQCLREREGSGGASVVDLPGSSEFIRLAFRDRAAAN
jgi:hypothetical protein